jgi:hypothetical protein
MKRITRLTESDLNRITKKILQEEEKEKMSLVKKLMQKLKGVSNEQIEYNAKHGLPWDWRGSKEGFYEKMEGKVGRGSTGSN